MPTSTTKILNTITWASFFTGLLTITIAYMSASFAGGTGAISSPPSLKIATSIGTSLMYLSLLIMPSIPLSYHAGKHDLNNYDYLAAGAQWLSYLLLPGALYLWDKPDTAKIGAGVLGLSLASLVVSVFLTRAATKKRHSNSPSSATASSGVGYAMLAGIMHP